MCNGVTPVTSVTPRALRGVSCNVSYFMVLYWREPRCEAPASVSVGQSWHLRGRLQITTLYPFLHARVPISRVRALCPRRDSPQGRQHANTEEQVSVDLGLRELPLRLHPCQRGVFSRRTNGFVSVPDMLVQALCFGAERGGASLKLWALRHAPPP